MRTQISEAPGAIVQTVTRYIGHEVSLTDDFSDDVGLDSIDRLNLMMAVEQAHNVELSDEEIASVSTLGELLHLLKVESGNDDRTLATGGNHENP